MSFMYPRTISVRRPAAQTGVGFQAGYAGEVAANETVVATGKPASIQARREGTKAPTGLPGDGTKPTWYVFIPRAALANGVVKNLDIVVDELGNRYQVIAPYWDSLGHRLSAELLDP